MLGFLLRWLVVSVPTGVIVGKYLKAIQAPPSVEDDQREIAYQCQRQDRP